MVADRALQPLFDITAFTLYTEQIRQSIWARRRTGPPPDHIEIHA